MAPNPVGLPGKGKLGVTGFPGPQGPPGKARPSRRNLATRPHRPRVQGPPGIPELVNRQDGIPGQPGFPGGKGEQGLPGCQDPRCLPGVGNQGFLRPQVLGQGVGGLPWAFWDQEGRKGPVGAPGLGVPRRAGMAGIPGPAWGLPGAIGFPGPS